MFESIPSRQLTWNSQGPLKGATDSVKIPYGAYIIIGTQKGTIILTVPHMYKR